ncbi:MAG TPA: twin-arginine translocase subunit TatC [Bacteroidales bacterium]|jgi:sec-independent protein translocase protein TatC|nr:twin-arginine translocase subunit TatC [Bacteroidales bacterium]HQH24281.1 twin-arginine translocase subunit TatC [Bacteroidales bacterium]HQJ81517.1 twin-arginine translocase subunit TatC [Bacteroidales bacterium]
MALRRKTGRKNEGEMSFLEHLEELRWHIIRSVLAIFVLMIVAFVLKNVIFDKIILAPKSPDFFTNRMLCGLGHAKIFGYQLNIDALCINTRELNLINIRMAGQLTTHILVALVAGIIMAFPVIIYEFWMFFKPALHENEARYTKGAVFSTTMLFFSGVLFGYFLLAPLSIHFLGSYHVSEDVVNQINIRSYIGTISSICLATGVIFELPVIAFFLTKIGVLTPAFMRQYRKHSIVVIFILAAIITPPDVFSQMLVAIPLLILYEVSIGISGRVIRKKEKEHDAFMMEDSIEKAQNTAT